MGNVGYLGIELGSTRIKAVLTGEDFKPLASGNCEWENKLVDGNWTYSLDDVWTGLQTALKELTTCKSVQGVNVGAIGISAMMHGYLAFDKNDNLLVPFRTWRNTTTEQAAEALTAEFGFNIPQRWSIAHLYQAILNGEAHVKDIAFITTLAGYVHWKLTGEKVLGVGDASGMFPVDSQTCDYNAEMLLKFDKLVEKYNFPWRLADILPKSLNAGESAGKLTEAGAKLLDPSGFLKTGTLLCPPEGDAGTGMVATNSIAPRTGNVSAGTSIFSMIVLEKELSKVYPEIDMVTTPDGKPVAMVHCNNCSSDLDAWVRLFGEVASLFGANPNKFTLYEKLYNKALEADDCTGLLTYNYLSGEPITGLTEGRPLLVRSPDNPFRLSELMRSLIFSALATLRIGTDILSEEGVGLDKLTGHGGLFKTPKVVQSLTASALNVPVAVNEAAGEGGAWGISLLAAYAANPAGILSEFLSREVFAKSAETVETPVEKDIQGFNAYLENYKRGLIIEKTATEVF